MHDQIPIYVRKDWRQAFLVVPGARLEEEAPNTDSLLPAVIDEKWADEVLAARPKHPVIVALPRKDHERECHWLARGADACTFLTDDLKVRVPQNVERSRARRTALNRIRKEDLRYQAMVENLMEVVTLLDGFGVILHESPSLKDVFGWEPEELIGRNSMEFVHPADVPRILKIIGEGRDIESLKVSAQYRFRHKDGSWRVVESKAVNLLHDRAVQSIVVVSRDVTDRHQALESLEASRARMAALLGAIPDAYVLVDAEGIYRDAHIPAGYSASQSADELIGRHISEILPAHLAERAVKAVMEVLETQQPTQFDYSIQVGGETRYREARVVPHSSELVLSVQRDITDRIRALQQVIQSEARFRTLFEASPDAIFLESVDGEVLAANPAACELHGCDLDWLIGKNVEDLVPEELRDDVAGAFRRLVTGDVDRGEGLSLRKNGAVVPVEFSVGRTVYEDREVLLLHVRDISKRREQEEMIEKLARYRQTAVEQERARISREVHDVLGQSLTGLRFDVSRIGRKLKGGMAKEIAATTEAIDGVIDDVRRIASELRPGILDDLGIGAAVEWQTKSVARRTGLQAHLVIEPDVKVGSGLGIALFRVLQELLTNVARHAEATSIWVSLRTNGTSVCLEVRDNGRGLQHQKDEDERITLGLMGIRERIQPWSGTLEMKNVPSGGTRAQVTIPATAYADPSTHSR